MLIPAARDPGGCGRRGAARTWLPSWHRASVRAWHRRPTSCVCTTTLRRSTRRVRMLYMRGACGAAAPRARARAHAYGLTCHAALPCQLPHGLTCHAALPCQLRGILPAPRRASRMLYYIIY